jgi:hypothetical protein
MEAAAAVTGAAVGNDVELAHLLVGPRTSVGSPKDITPCLWYTPSFPPPVCWGNSRAVPHLEFHSTVLQVHMPQAVSPIVCNEDSPEGYPRAPTIPAQVQQQTYSNVVKRYANWNACYSCGSDVADGHTSMSCPPRLRKAMHQIGFNCQNAQQFIDLGNPCSTRNRHKTQLPAPI